MPPSRSPGLRAPTLVLAAVAAGTALTWLVVANLDTATMQLIADWHGPLWLTLRVSLVAIVLAALAGVGTGYFLARTNLPGRDTIEALLSVPMILPPTVLGYYVLVTFSTDTWAGRRRSRSSASLRSAASRAASWSRR